MTLLLSLLACWRAHAPDTDRVTSLVETGADSVPDTQPVEMVRVDGLVFRFIDRRLMEGATVTLEGVGVQTQSAADGSWSAQVPAGVPFTPVIALDGYITARHATFTLEQDEPRMYLQAVPVEVFGLMESRLADAGLSRDPEGCVVVNTITVPEIAAMETWEQFYALRPHGEPGVVMELVPDTHGSFPIYFNEQVAPDPTLTASSRDGGVLWMNVAPGEYTVQGTHPDPENFQVDARQIRCEPGWFVNLNPVLGAGVSAI
ncbi:MAG: hypothetical protein VX899_09870 [Myxococcota bacterium]|nr:hypothetical protein [Myxococcota bacterium]